MKHAAFLLLGLALLPHAVQSDQASVSVCVDALEQLETLQTVAPVYKLTAVQKRQYLNDSDRPAEIARIKTIIAGSCSAKSKTRQREESEAQQLHLVRSPACMQDRDRLSMMERQNARTPEDDLARTRKRVLAQCPDVDLSSVWLVEWIPIARYYLTLPPASKAGEFKYSHLGYVIAGAIAEARTRRTWETLIPAGTINIA